MATTRASDPEWDADDPDENATELFSFDMPFPPRTVRLAVRTTEPARPFREDEPAEQTAQTVQSGRFGRFGQEEPVILWSKPLPGESPTEPRAARIESRGAAPPRAANRPAVDRSGDRAVDRAVSRPGRPARPPIPWNATPIPLEETVRDGGGWALPWLAWWSAALVLAAGSALTVALTAWTVVQR